MDYVLLAAGLCVAIGVGVSVSDRRLARADRRLARVERKLDAIAAHVGVPPEAAEPALPEVLALLRDGRKIQAIKVYRERTGAGLKDARDAVERLA